MVLNDDLVNKILDDDLSPEEEDRLYYNPYFIPPQLSDIEETGIPLVMVEDIIFKTLATFGAMSGKKLSEFLKVPFPVLEPVLADLKNRLFVAHRMSAGMGDFLYINSDLGMDRARQSTEMSGYYGPLPVPFDYYVRSVKSQTIINEKPGQEQLEEAFSDLLIPQEVLDTLGPAVNSAKGLFLYGEPGNGKTSIAERISKSFRTNVFIPHALFVEGQIIKLYDPQNHEAVRLPSADEGGKPRSPFDHRWALIKRPAVVVGGELMMEALDLQFNEFYKVSEAPLQMKANNGVFLIDDFGRQRISHVELLNRWIVPLEKRVDFLTLANGMKIEVPFDELIIFSTNLQPHDLVDEAFLRRIPYKIHMKNPTEEIFRKIFRMMCGRMGIEYDDDIVTYLIETHYRGKRGFRACQPRDILAQVANACSYKRTDAVLTPTRIDLACKNYFAAMGNEAETEMMDYTAVINPQNANVKPKKTFISEDELKLEKSNLVREPNPYSKMEASEEPTTSAQASQQQNASPFQSPAGPGGMAGIGGGAGSVGSVGLGQMPPSGH